MSLNLYIKFYSLEAFAMRSIRLAVVFDSHIRTGGGYQQALNASLLTRELPSSLAEVYYFTTLPENVTTLENYGIAATLIRVSFIDKILVHLRRRGWRAVLKDVWHLCLSKRRQRH